MTNTFLQSSIRICKNLIILDLWKRYKDYQLATGENKKIGYISLKSENRASKMGWRVCLKSSVLSPGYIWWKETTDSRSGPLISTHRIPTFTNTQKVSE